MYIIIIIIIIIIITLFPWTHTQFWCTIYADNSCIFEFVPPARWRCNLLHCLSDGGMKIKKKTN